MELTQEQISKIVAEEVAKAKADEVAKAKTAEIAKAAATFTPDVKVTKDETDNFLSDPKCGFKTRYHFIKAVVSQGMGHEPEELKRYNSSVAMVAKTNGYVSEGDFAQGGAFIPVAFLKEVQERSLEEEIVYPRVDMKLPMETNRILVPCDVDKDHTYSFFGTGTGTGIIVNRQAENGLLAETSPGTGQVALTLHNISGMVRISNEMLQDSPFAMDVWLTNKFVQAIHFSRDYDYLFGDGVNQSHGMLHAANPCLYTVTRNTSTRVLWDDIKAMKQCMPQQLWASAIFLANHELYSELASMNQVVAFGGIPVWLPGTGFSGAAGAPFDSLLGRPLIFSEKMQALGTAGDIALVSFRPYMIAEKNNGDVAVASSIHLYFNYNQMAFRYTLRTDGAPTWLSTLKPLHGSIYLAPAVVLSTK